MVLLKIVSCYLSIAVLLIVGKMRAVLTVSDVVLRHPLTCILSSLGGDFYNPHVAFEIHL